MASSVPVGDPGAASPVPARCERKDIAIGARPGLTESLWYVSRKASTIPSLFMSPNVSVCWSKLVAGAGYLRFTHVGGSAAEQAAECKQERC